MTRIITLLTDFGTADGYVGEMKGVLAANAPDCTLIDIAHASTPKTEQNATEIQPARSARSTRPAPRFWPTIAAVAAPQPTPIMYNQLSTRCPIPSAASAGVPNCVAVRVTIT